MWLVILTHSNVLKIAKFWLKVTKNCLFLILRLYVLLLSFFLYVKIVEGAFVCNLHICTLLIVFWRKRLWWWGSDRCVCVIWLFVSHSSAQFALLIVPIKGNGITNMKSRSVTMMHNTRRVLRDRNYECFCFLLEGHGAQAADLKSFMDVG